MFEQVSFAVREYVTQRLIGLVRYRRAEKPSADTWDEATGWPAGPGEPAGSDQVRRIQHYGFRSQPPAGAELVTLAVGGSAAQHITVASEVAGAGPTDLKDGEVSLYSGAGALVKLDKDGAVSITTQAGAAIKIDKNGAVTVDAAAGQQVVIQGGAAAAVAAARYNDPVAANASMVAWMAAVNAAFAALVPPVTLPTPPATFAFIANGSSNCKIG